MNPLAADLDHVLAHTQGLWEERVDNAFYETSRLHRNDGCQLCESAGYEPPSICTPDEIMKGEL